MVARNVFASVAGSRFLGNRHVLMGNKWCYSGYWLIRLWYFGDKKRGVSVQRAAASGRPIRGTEGRIPGTAPAQLLGR